MNWIILLRTGWLMPARLVLMVALVSMIQWHSRPQITAPPPGASPQASTRSAAAKPLGSSAIITDQAAARFLAQATFGPTLEEIARVRDIGYGRWIRKQVALPPSYQLDYLDAAGPDMAGRQLRMEAWFQDALGGPDAFVPGVVHRDQLRQRVAFALSELLVASEVPDNIGNYPYGVASFYDVLARNAFGNYRQLLEEVTLHPVMGLYLSMLGNQKPDPSRNVRPDENFAREVLQLFSIGTMLLKTDGTPMLDAGGQEIPTYDQFAIRGFAHVFTGWTFSTCTTNFKYCPVLGIADPAWRESMQPVAAYHASAGSKQLLNYPGVALPGGVLPAGGSAQSDLQAALDNIFRHPNVGPFIGKQLIQRLVTSNPSPAYVARVAAKFNNNRSGVRGDLEAVIKAILLDPEARDRDRQPPDFGKIREPVLRLTHLWRSLDARSESGRMAEWYPQGILVQAPLRSPSVFNFFRPDYSPTGELTELGLVAPELQLATGDTLPKTNNGLGSLIFTRFIGNPYIDFGPNAILVDLDRDAPLAADPDALLNRYDLLFMSGQMSPAMRRALLARLNEIPNGNGGRDRVQEALYLITTSPEYMVQK